MPKVTATYFLPKGQTALVVTQTMGCNNDGDRLLTAASAVATTTYLADLQKAQHVDLSKYGGQLIDADVAINTTSDGRLSGVNSTSAGETASVIKSGVALAGATLGLFAFDGGKPAVDVKAACKEISTLAGAKSADGTGKLLTLTYSATFSYSDDGQAISLDQEQNASTYPSGPQKSVTLNPDPDTPNLGAALSFLKTAFKLEYTPPGPSKNEAIGMAEWADAGSRKTRGFRALTLNKVASAQLTVKGPGAQLEPAARPIWTGAVYVPLTDKTHLYELPIPSGLYFGKQGFALALSDDGTITKLEYSANTGTSDALDASTSLLSAMPTTSAKAAAKKDQADLIYQQQRLVICKLTPSSCPSS